MRADVCANGRRGYQSGVGSGRREPREWASRAGAVGVLGAVQQRQKEPRHQSANRKGQRSSAGSARLARPAPPETFGAAAAPARTSPVPAAAPGPGAAPDPDAAAPGAGDGSGTGDGTGTAEAAASLPVLGQHIAVARDEAFSFVYPLVLEAWRRAGAEVSTFSPLAGEPPPPGTGAVYLPGGYPELHAGRIAAARPFLAGLRAAAGRGALVYGECGGYMVLGESLVDADGEAHAMAGLLPVATTFAERRLTLGYRTARNLARGALGPAGTGFRGHEFHYARVLREGGGEALFRCADARGRDLGPVGRRVGPVMGSFVHLIDRMDEDDPALRAAPPDRPPISSDRPGP